VKKKLRERNLGDSNVRVGAAKDHQLPLETLVRGSIVPMGFSRETETAVAQPLIRFRGGEDAQLAALTTEYGGILHTTDRDFARFSGLRFTNPLQ